MRSPSGRRVAFSRLWIGTILAAFPPRRTSSRLYKYGPIPSNRHSALVAPRREETDIKLQTNVLPVSQYDERLSRSPSAMRSTGEPCCQLHQRQGRTHVVTPVTNQILIPMQRPKRLLRSQAPPKLRTQSRPGKTILTWLPTSLSSRAPASRRRLR